MLIDEPKIMAPMQDRQLATLLAMIGCGGDDPARLQQGIYEIPHFSGEHMLGGGYEKYPELNRDDEAAEYVNCYGVCDGVQNLLDKAPVLQHPERKFVVTLTAVRRADEPSDGGWRWHKWGPYIGAHDPQHEYLADEVDIDVVYCYHIYEKRDMV